MDTATLHHVVGTLSAIDYDGPRGNLRSSDFIWALTDNDQGRFAINGPSVVVAAALDHEAHRYHRITVNCTDKDTTNPRSVQATIIINVINTNDSPKKLLLVQKKLFENQTTGFVAGQLIATDGDGDDLRFSLAKSDSTTRSTFELGPAACVNVSINGIKRSECKANVVLKRSIDYETKNSYNLKVTATDPSGSFTIKDFRVHVVNLNEAPTDITISNDQVYENSVAGIIIAHIIVSS